ncbi:MAG TPA: AraC family transcriptional regulator [Phycisphaerae bacterium]|nr:AraC family transcriptional regulator [Phycisphaerales bacterium]HNO77312.1 AraC family transcriptional regulator [Phycisphaerae bacterium]
MKRTTQQDYHARILRVLVHIQNSLDDALSLEELASISCFSPYHFHRVFKGMVGESVMQHVRRLRLERAALRLVHTDQAITHVAFDAGYEALEAFSRAFRTAFGASPSEYRIERRQAILPLCASGIHFSPDTLIKDFKPQSKGAESMDVRIEKLPPKRVAFVRNIGPYQEAGKAWEKLMAWAGPRGLFNPNASCLGLCHDDPDVTPADKIRYDACLAVGDDFEGEGEIGVQEISGGNYAIARHNGPYENLADTYAALCGQWLPSSGHEPRDAPPFEVYLNNPQDTPPADLKTDVHVAIS